MYKIDSSKIKSQLTLEHYQTLLKELGATPYKENDKEIVYTSICHHLDASGHKPKLYFYKESKFFMCYSCSCSMSIFDLIMKRLNLLKQKCSFIDALNFVIEKANLPIEKTQRITPRDEKNIDDWERDLSRFLRVKNGDSVLRVYNNAILNFFEKKYHESFINDGITIKTMEKYQVGYYRYKQCITIPVFDLEGNLIGIHGRNLIPELIEAGYKYMPVKLLDGTEYKFPTNQVLFGANLNKSNIEHTKEICIFEAPKSVMQMESVLEYNNSVGIFGMNLGIKRRDMILNMGVDTVNICLDRQYKDFDDEEYQKWEKQVLKIAQLFAGYCKVYVVYDKEDVLSYKDSPSDKGKEVWNELYKRREVVL